MKMRRLSQGVPRDGRFGFTDNQAEGAIPNGTRVSRTDYELEDGSIPEGSEGTILGSMGPVTEGMALLSEYVGMYGYFVEWDEFPGVPVFTIGLKLKEKNGNSQVGT